jgi:phosphoglycolate phosphatase
MIALRRKRRAVDVTAMDTICFDLDGTLTDPKLGITRCIRHALMEVTGEAPDADALTWCIGPPLIGSFETLLAGNGDAALALARYRERFGDVGLFENEVYPAIPETLAALTASGFRLFVATSKPTVYARRIVEHFGLAPYFEDVCGAELDGRRSDKTELLSWLLERHGIAPASATMVGDRSHDIVGARNNDMRTVGVLYGYGTEAELTEAGAEILCPSPDALTEILAPRGEPA